MVARVNWVVVISQRCSRLMKSIIKALSVFICLLTITAFLALGSFVGTASASNCPNGTSCPKRCDDFAQVMEERTPFYYEGDFVDSCVTTLNQSGIRVREEGTGSASVIILTTIKPFPFRSEWVGRRGRTPDSWYFEQYKA